MLATNTVRSEMEIPAVLDWVNSNAPAVTAVATIFLVLITGVYVVVTYLLVREQRLQSQAPDIAVEWADTDPGYADLKLRNVGNGAATQLTILKGPGDGVPVEEAHLGVRRTLLPGEATNWKVRPPDDAEEFEPGELPLTMAYLNNNRTKVMLEVLVIQFVENDEGVGPHLTGSASAWWTRSELRRMTAKSLPRGKRARFRWSTRKTRLSFLLLDQEVRLALRANLLTVASRLKTVNRWAQDVQRHI